MSTMLSPNSLQPPKMGTSRWSKALPEVPGIDFNDIYDEYEDEEPSPVSPENKDLPRLPIPPPPPRSTSMATTVKTINSSLPPLPIIDTGVASVPSRPPMMAIPRRPVGKQPSRLVQPMQQQLPQQAQPPSPTQSISSILSAYSNSSSSDDSPIRSSESTRQSEANASSPSHQQAPPASSNTETLISPSSTEQKLPPTHQPHYHVRAAPAPPVKVKTDIPPRPPIKDTKYELSPSPVVTPSPATATAKATATTTATASDLNTSSPPRPQIWRRRSVKAERSLELPDLKLVGSHGSTAASAPMLQQPVTKKPVARPVEQTQAQAQPVVQSVTQSNKPYLPPGVVKVSTLTYQPPRAIHNKNAETNSTKTAVHPTPAPIQAAPVQVAPVQVAPAQAAPIRAPPVQTAPVQTTPNVAPIRAAPVQTVPVALSAPSAPTPNTAVEADSPTMGSGSSKLNKLKDKLHTFHRRGKSSIDTSSDSTGRPGARRPPTPEYQKQDVKTPIIDSFVSPLSPASSPEPLAEVSPELSKELPKSPDGNHTQHQPTQFPNQILSPNGISIESKPPPRKAVPPPAALDFKPLPEAKSAPKPPAPVQNEPGKLVSEPAPEPPAPTQNEYIKPVTEQKLKAVAESEAESPVTGSLPPLVTDFSSRRSSGADSPASRAHHSAEVPTRFPPRGSSVRSNAPRLFEQQPRHPPEDQDPRLVPSESQGYLYRGRDGTLYPEMKVVRDPDPQAAYFPTQMEKAVPVDTIFRAAPLKDSHYSCYQGHRTMNRRVNRNYPLTCQTCEKPDTEDRWVCTFCHLRICETCFTTLNGYQRNLYQLIDEIGQQRIPAA